MKYDFKMTGNICVYNDTTLAAVMHERDEPESVPEEERQYVLWLLRKVEGEAVIPLEGTVIATGHEFEMVHETLMLTAGLLRDVDEYEDEEIDDASATLDLLSRLLGG